MHCDLEFGEKVGVASEKSLTVREGVWRVGRGGEGWGLLWRGEELQLAATEVESCWADEGSTLPGRAGGGGD